MELDACSPNYLQSFVKHFQGDELKNLNTTCSLGQDPSLKGDQSIFKEKIHIQEEQAKLLSLEKSFHGLFVSQDHSRNAIHPLSDADYIRNHHTRRLNDSNTHHDDFERVFQKYKQEHLPHYTSSHSPWSIEYDFIQDKQSTPLQLGREFNTVPLLNDHQAWSEEFSKYENLLDFNESKAIQNEFDEVWNSAEWMKSQISMSETTQDKIVPASDTNFLFEYYFEMDNPYLTHPHPFEEGCRIMNENGNLTEASLAFEAALQQGHRHSTTADTSSGYDDAFQMNAWLHLAQCQAENEKESAAIIAYKKCLEIHPTHADALMGLAISYTNEGMEGEALNLITKWLKSQYPNASQPFHTMTNETDLYRQRDLVIHAVSSILPTHPTDVDLLVGLGIIYYNSCNYEKSIECFTTALTHRPKDYSLWNRLGATLANSNQCEEAIVNYEKALWIKSNYVRARHNLGVSCMNIGCYAEALEYIISALSTHSPSHKNISTNLWQTLKRCAHLMNRQDLLDLCEDRNLHGLKLKLNMLL